jgi:hypothetical protein
MDSTIIAYRISKKYVENTYPELRPFFDRIWEVASSNARNGSKKRQTSENYTGIGFLSETSLVQIMDVVIPFLTGVFSIVVADVIIKKTDFGSKNMAKIVEKSAEKVRINLQVDKKTAQQLLPYLLMGVSNSKSLKETHHLEDLLDDRLRTIYDQIRNDRELGDLLLHIQNAHPNFTSHGPDHSEAIIENVEKLIPEKDWRNFSSLEILILLCSAWFHDVGMSDFEGKISECSNEEERRNLSNFIRESHSLRSENYVTNSNNYRRLLLDPAVAEVIGCICKAHVEYDLMKLKSKWGPIHGYEKYGEVRVRFLAALLRLADACDLGYKRVKEVLITVYDIPKNYAESIPHLDGALLVTDVLVMGREIVVQAVPRNKEQQKFVEFVTKELEEDFTSVKGVLRDSKTNGFDVLLDSVRLETLETEGS